MNYLRNRINYLSDGVAFNYVPMLRQSIASTHLSASDLWTARAVNQLTWRCSRYAKGETVLFNRYPFEPAINLLYAPTCGRRGNKAEFPRVKSDVRAGIGGPGFSCCSRPIVGIVPLEIQSLAVSMLYNTLCVVKSKVRTILVCCGFVG